MERNLFTQIKTYIDNPLDQGLNTVFTTAVVYSISVLLGFLVMISPNDMVQIIGLLLFLLITIVWSQWIFWEHRGPKWSLFRSIIAVMVFFIDFTFWLGISNNDLNWLVLATSMYLLLQALIWWNPPIKETLRFT